MLSKILSPRWLKRLPCRKLPEVYACQKNGYSQSKVSYSKHLTGYTRSNSISFLSVIRKRYNEPKRFSTSQINSSDFSDGKLDSVQFEKISEETLQSLMEYFDELIERADHLQEADVSYGSGVLTVKFGEEHGTYVINRQTPNRQIWLSSPKSGPKRYDFADEKWIYKHDGKSLHALLDDEIPAIVKQTTTFVGSPHSGKKSTRENSHR